jgi:hypothetical protein
MTLLKALCAQRPLKSDVVDHVHNELLLVFIHFSLKHEGNNLGIDGTKMITDLLSKKDSKHLVEDQRQIDKPKRFPGRRTTSRKL